MNRLKTIKTEEILTGGKTRQKRNGPGGSGCFHAFCYFLRTAGAGLCAAETGRRRALRGGDRPARIWCTNPRKTLFLRLPCTKSERLFGDRPARIWCTIPRKTLFLRFPCTNSERLFGDRPARTWCTIPRKTLFLRSLCTKSGSLFGDRPVSFHKNTLPQKEGVFNSYGESIRLRRASGFSRRPNSVQISCYSLPRPLPRPATRRSTSVSFISSDTIMPSISSSFSTSSSGKRFRIRWQTMLM